MHEPSKVPGQDPGWKPALRFAMPMLRLFPMGPLPRRSGQTADGLTLLRTIYLALFQASFLILIVAWFMTRDDGADGPEPAALWPIPVLLGALSIVIARYIRDRKPDVSSADALADNYRTNFFLGFALVEGPLLIGFVLSIITDALWLYVISLAFFCVAFITMGPSRRNLARVQERIHHQGASYSIVGVLQEMGAPR